MHFESILEHSACILEHSGIYWNSLEQSGTVWNSLELYRLHNFKLGLKHTDTQTDTRTLVLVELRLRS